MPRAIGQPFLHDAIEISPVRIGHVAQIPVHFQLNGGVDSAAKTRAPAIPAPAPGPGRPTWPAATPSRYRAWSAACFRPVSWPDPDADRLLRPARARARSRLPSSIRSAVSNWPISSCNSRESALRSCSCDETNCCDRCRKRTSACSLDLLMGRGFLLERRDAEDAGARNDRPQHQRRQHRLPNVVLQIAPPIGSGPAGAIRNSPRSAFPVLRRSQKSAWFPTRIHRP